jgi:hypothetical protein
VWKVFFYDTPPTIMCMLNSHYITNNMLNEGGNDIKSTWLLSIGPYVFYNGN